MPAEVCMSTLETVLLLLSHVSRVRLCATPWTAAHQAPVPGILQARILEWAAISFSLETVSVTLKETLATYIHNIKHLNNCIYF